MKLKKYLKHLNDLVKENPELLECDVICEICDCDDFFTDTVLTPTAGIYENGDFFHPGDVRRYTKSDINAVCIN